MSYKFNPFTGNFDTTANAAGITSSIQYNQGNGVFGGSSDLTWDDSAKELGVGGDINLDDGGTYETTVQVVTPTANRTISFPDASGTVALVAGSSGQLTYNNAGAQDGLTSANIGSTGEINISLAGAASTPPVSFTGSWFTGGTATTTKPQLLIEPTGTTSTAWSTDGTGLGINAPSGFSGRLLDLQTNGTSRMVVQGDGYFGLGTSSPLAELHLNDATGVSRIRLTGGAVGANSFEIGQAITGVSNSGFSIYDVDATATRFVIDSSGRVGILTTSPNRLLEVSGSGTSTRLTSSTNTSTLEFSTPGGFAYIGSKDGPNVYVETNGSERARIDSSGRLLVGTSSALTTRLTTTTLTPSFQVKEGGGGSALFFCGINGATPATVFAAKSRGTSYGTIVQNNDGLLRISAAGDDGVQATEAARIEAFVDGTPGANDMPGRLVFSTTADGASSPTERMRITSDAYVRLASGTGGIQFNGDTAAANALDDYEEGTFTPTVIGTTTAGTATYTGQLGEYTKIGRLVYCSIYVNYSGGTGTGNLRIAGLPFTVATGGGIHLSLFSNIALDASSVATGYAYENTTQILFSQYASGGGQYTFVAYDAAGEIALSVCYRV